MRALRLVAVLALLVLGTLAALLAADVRSWQRTLADGNVAARQRLPWSVAERVLAVGDDVQARRAIALFRATASVRPRLDNAQAVTAARTQRTSGRCTPTSGCPGRRTAI